MKKALIIGINEYPNSNKLYGCVNDANAINNLLSNNGDNSHNFDTLVLLDKKVTYKKIIEAIDDLYKNNDDVSLLYFSGHGYDDKNDGSLITVDMKQITFKYIMSKINEAKTKYNIIILDCCFSGKIGIDATIGDNTILSDDTVILTACRSNEVAIDDIITNHGKFTNLLIGALEGGASDLLGRITPGSIYAYIDQALGSWEPRPYFKANVSTFTSLRNVKTKISIEKLKEGMRLFNNSDSELQLDPSYEDTNFKGNHMHKAIKPYAKEKNIAKFKILQKMNQNGLVIPVDEEFMYFAAMNSKKVRLTELGKHYWNLYKSGRI